jgi:hypothetical protein
VRGASTTEMAGEDVEADADVSADALMIDSAAAPEV